MSEFNKENNPIRAPKKRGRPKKESSTQPKTRKKAEVKGKSNAKKFLSQPSPPHCVITSQDYTQFQKKMASLPTELETLKIQNKNEIENFKKLWINYSTGLNQINQENGIENLKIDAEYEFDQMISKTPKNYYSQDIFLNISQLSPPPPSVSASVKQHISKIEEAIVSDQFIFGIDDLEALSLHLNVDFNKMLYAATILRNNGTIKSEDDVDDVIPCSQSPRKRRDFWEMRITQTQRRFGK